ncbi:MAG: hypothetical protein BJ554DRAFT_6477 [Olpidium bornovanus]|uniref:Uncharacterized protein n=1 Tax=Olpidium bornovanus TaxID=278681 RepID=A0A8H8DKN3_9FUNG|nr:MAG: hypothetical protein BJ554DRAFT_6477 [Olpidium bornovanus]
MLEVETATNPPPKPPQRRAPPAACRNLPSLSTIEQSCEEAAGKPSASSGPVLQQAGSASSATVNDATGLANARGIVVDATSPGRPASGNLPRRGQKPGRMMGVEDDHQN